MTRKWTITLACLAVLAIPALTLADCVTRARAVTYSHATYNYATPYYYPVAVFEPLKAVYAVGGGYRSESAETAELARALEKLTGAVDRLSSKAAGTQPAQADAVEAKAVQVLSTRCASCHTGEASKKGFKLFASAGQLNPSLTRDEVFHAWEAADSGRMPEGGPPIPDEEAKILREWLSRRAAADRAARKPK